MAEDFPSDWDYWAPIFRLVWKTAFGVEFDAWQEWLFRALLEVYPADHPRAGELRYRTAFVSVGRQNGKSVIGAVLGLWGLLRQVGGLTVGIASNAEQAGIVYDRIRQAIDSNPALKAKFKRVTGTRGLETTDNSIYTVKPAKSASLQGLAISTGVVDEVHLVSPELWADLQRGTGARLNTFVFGITTAGSNDSKLLLNLYESGNKAADGDPSLERFGCFIWQAPDSAIPEDDDALIELLKPANPRLASGLVDRDAFVSDVRTNPDGEIGIVRYSLNRFVGTISGFVSPEAWARASRAPGSTFPSGLPVVLALDVSPSLSWATATVAALDPDTGVTHTEVIFCRPNPDHAWLIRAMEKLNEWHAPALILMDGFHLKPVAEELKKRGIKVQVTYGSDAVRSASLFTAKLARRQISHAGDPILAGQLKNAKRKEKDGGYRIVAGPGKTEIEALCSTVLAIYGAEIAPESSGIFVF